MLAASEIIGMINGSKLERLSCKVDPLGASSKRLTFVSEYGGQRYKLRKCFSTEDALGIEKKVNALSHLSITPKYQGRYNEWLCFDYLCLPEAKRDESSDFWNQLGFRIAQIESIPSDEVDISFSLPGKPIQAENFRDYLTKASEEMCCRSYLNTMELRKLSRKLDYISSKEVKFSYGYLDLLPGNVLVDNEKIFIADEEGFAGAIKGLSLIRPIDIWKGQTPELGMGQISKKHFLKGYYLGGGDREFYEENENSLGLIYYLLKSYASIKESGTTKCSLRRLQQLI